MFENYGPVIKTTDMGRTNYFTNSPTIAAIAMSESPFFSKIINENHPLHGLKDNTAGLFIGDTDTEEWRLAHKFMASAFSAKAVRHYTPLIQREVESSYPVFDELDKRREAWDVSSYMLKLVSSAIGKLILNQQFKSFDDVDSPQPRIVQAVDELVATNRRVSTKGQWYSHLPFGDPKKLRELNVEIRKMIEEAINSCERAEVGDLPMVDAALKASSIVDYALRATDSQGNKCPREIIIRTMLVLLVAGFFTTSALLSWLIHGLITYPGLQDRLLQELVDHGVNGETEWTYDNTNTLLFLNNYINETLRMHTPVINPARTAKVDLILPGGYKIPAGATMICVSEYQWVSNASPALTWTRRFIMCIIMQTFGTILTGSIRTAGTLKRSRNDTKQHSYHLHSVHEAALASISLFRKSRSSSHRYFTDMSFSRLERLRCSTT